MKKPKGMSLPFKNQALYLVRNFKLADSENIHCIVYPPLSQASFT